MAYPSSHWQHFGPQLGLQPIAQASLTQAHPLGSQARAVDTAYGEGTFVYLLGVASTAPGDVVAYNSGTGATTRVLQGTTTTGPLAVAMSACTAGLYGWYQVAGAGPAKVASVAAGASAALSTTAGQLDDGASGAGINGLTFETGNTGGYATVQLAYPTLAPPLAIGQTVGATGSTDDAFVQYALTRAASSNGGVVYLPPGVYSISQALAVTSAHAIHLQGVGGQPDIGSSPSVTLKWVGASGGTMLTFAGGHGHSVDGIRLDGNSLAGEGLWWYGKSTVGLARQGHFRNFSIVNVTQGNGRALHVGESTDYQTSEATFSNFSIYNCKVGIFQQGQQTINVRYKDFMVANYSQYGADFENGSVETHCGNFESSNAAALADVRVQGSCATAYFFNNYHETANGMGYDLSDGHRTFATTWTNCRVQVQGQGLTNQLIIKYRQAGQCNTNGCEWLTSEASSLATARVWFGGQFGFSPCTLNEAGCQYLNGAWLDLSNGAGGVANTAYNAPLSFLGSYSVANGFGDGTIVKVPVSRAASIALSEFGAIQYNYHFAVKDIYDNSEVAFRDSQGGTNHEFSLKSVNGQLCLEDNLTGNKVWKAQASGRLDFMLGQAFSPMGTSGAMVAGVVTISTTAVTASSKIFVSHTGTNTANLGVLYALSSEIVAGTSFKIRSSNAADTDTVNWWLSN